jgi:hypothetical protein
MLTSTQHNATPTHTTIAATDCQTAAATSAPISTPAAMAADSSWKLSGRAGGALASLRLSRAAIRACRESTAPG